MACVVLLAATAVALVARRREMREVAAGAARLVDVDRAMRATYVATLVPQAGEETPAETDGPLKADEPPPPATPPRRLEPVTAASPRQRSTARRPLPGDSPTQLVQRLDTAIEAFRVRPLASGPYRYVWLDAVRIPVQERGRTQHVPALVATAVNARGRREVVGFDAATSKRIEWTPFLASLVERGLAGVELVISDDIASVHSSVTSALDGAAWQYCRAHFLRSLMARVPRTAHPSVGQLVRSIFEQSSPWNVEIQHSMVALELLARFPAAGELLDRAGEDIIAFRRSPVRDWPRIWSNEAHERRMRQVRREAFERQAMMRSIGERLLAQHDRWASGRRYATPGQTTPTVAVVPERPQEPAPAPLAAVG